MCYYIYLCIGNNSRGGQAGSPNSCPQTPGRSAGSTEQVQCPKNPKPYPKPQTLNLKTQILVQKLRADSDARSISKETYCISKETYYTWMLS